MWAKKVTCKQVSGQHQEGSLEGQKQAPPSPKVSTCKLVYGGLCVREIKPAARGWT